MAVLCSGGDVLLLVVVVVVVVVVHTRGLKPHEQQQTIP